MNREDRAQIRQVVLECRRILEEEFDQLLRLHGLLPDRKVGVPPERETYRVIIDEALFRESADYSVARRRFIKYAAFTFLNRLIVLRLAEAHGLIPETVLTRPEYGDRSRRERDLADNDANLAVNPEKLTYEALKQAFFEMGAFIPLLFHKEDPYGLLMPRLSVLREVRRILARIPDSLWREFETLGWAYQYFNSEEREEIRRRLRRNPHPDDIPPINQFYTVGWIVKALVQNTLGRLWLEAYPNSPLRTQLDYLVPLRNDFRAPNRKLSVQDIKVLDPACGSGHFLLYAFDLLVYMWQEEFPELPRWKIPALILEQNLFGIDIDLRACQIAASSLYLKARVTFEALKGEDPKANFEPKRINIICADIHFTDSSRAAKVLNEFSHDRQLQNIVKETLAACEKAFEIGSLLRIRQPFEKLFSQRKAKLEELRKKKPRLPLPLFPLDEERLSSGDISITVPKPLTVEEIVERIREFTVQASARQDMGYLLFGWDAEHAMQLVDVLTETFDVVLMNPPYGSMPSACKQYARQHFPRTHRDFYAAFIEQAIGLCKDGGYIGALTGRTFLFLRSYQKLREEILRQEALPELVLDLGFNVLDEATARYAAFTLRKRHKDDGVSWEKHPVTFFRLTNWDWDEKRVKFEEALKEMKD